MSRYIASERDLPRVWTPDRQVPAVALCSLDIWHKCCTLRARRKAWLPPSEAMPIVPVFL